MLPRQLATCLIVVLMTGLTGCTPFSMTFTFGDKPGELTESVVRSYPPNATSKSTPKVAIIDIEGLIMDASPPGLLGRTPNPTDAVVRRLDAAARDSTVRAIVLRINSPGGTVTGSEAVYDEIRAFSARTQKPVIASLGEVAASGGYYVALAADSIIAHPTTITASIGVIIPTLNFSSGMERIGIQSRAVKSGGNKDIANPLEPMKESHYALLQELVDEFYVAFVDHVLERRPTFAASPYVQDMTDGRVITGRKAVDVGLADAVGSYDDALKAAMEAAGISKARIIKYSSNARLPQSPYAMAANDTGAARQSDGATEINLMKLEVDALSMVGGGNAYYLWRP